MATIALLNDMSTKGMIPDAHLADGVAHLLLVRKCGRFNFLRFLARLAHTGTHIHLPYVERIPIKAVKFFPQGLVTVTL